VASHILQKYAISCYSTHLAQKINAPATTGYGNTCSIMFTFIAFCLQVIKIIIYKTAKCTALRISAFHLDEKELTKNRTLSRTCGPNNFLFTSSRQGWWKHRGDETRRKIVVGKHERNWALREYQRTCVKISRLTPLYPMNGLLYATGSQYIVVGGKAARNAWHGCHGRHLEGRHLEGHHLEGRHLGSNFGILNGKGGIWYVI